MKSPWDDLVDEISRRPPARAAWAAFGIIVILILAAALCLHFIARMAIPAARAQDVPRVIFDCQQLGNYARRIAMLRELGAQRDKVLEQLRRELRPGMLLAVLEREAKRVYAEKPSGPEAELSAYRRCQAQLGDMGQEG